MNLLMEKNSIKLINKIKNNRILSSNLQRDTFEDINIHDNEISNKIILILDVFLNKYDNSIKVTKNLNTIILKSFNALQKEEPLKFAKKEMQTLADSEYVTCSNLYNQIKSILDEILSGDLKDFNKNEIENINESLYEIRKLRTLIIKVSKSLSSELKDAYKDLAWEITTAIANLKESRNSLGYGIITYDDISDYEINNELFERLQ